MNDISSWVNFESSQLHRVRFTEHADRIRSNASKFYADTLIENSAMTSMFCVKSSHNEKYEFVEGPDRINLGLST